MFMTTNDNIKFREWYIFAVVYTLCIPIIIIITVLLYLGIVSNSIAFQIYCEK
jgi:hypothetical protein